MTAPLPGPQERGERRRCRKHCLHRITPEAGICCHCGRAVNVALPYPTRWVPRTDHGPHYLGPTLTVSSGHNYNSVHYHDPLSRGFAHRTSGTR